MTRLSFIDERHVAAADEANITQNDLSHRTLTWLGRRAVCSLEGTDWGSYPFVIIAAVLRF